MQTYLMHFYNLDVYRTTTVEADSEKEAREKFLANLPQDAQVELVDIEPTISYQAKK